VLLRAGKYDDAIADYNAALEIDPKRAASLYGRGSAKLRKGDYEAGNADIAAARVMRPNISVEYQGYGLMPPLTDLPGSAAPQSADDARVRKRGS
jgi:tetratricopeptide (TPR) repeat protein